MERQLLWCGAECDTEQEQGQVGLLTGEPLTITPVEGPISKGHRTDLIQNLPTHPFGDPVSSEVDVMPFVYRVARRQSAACCVVCFGAACTHWQPNWSHPVSSFCRSEPRDNRP